MSQIEQVMSQSEQINQKRNERRERIVSLTRQIGGEDAVSRVLHSFEAQDRKDEQLRRIADLPLRHAQEIEEARQELQLTTASGGEK